MQQRKCDFEFRMYHHSKYGERKEERRVLKLFCFKTLLLYIEDISKSGISNIENMTQYAISKN